MQTPPPSSPKGTAIPPRSKRRGASWPVFCEAVKASIRSGAREIMPSDGLARLWAESIVCRGGCAATSTRFLPD